VLFCFNDLMAMGVMQAAHEQGLRIPADLAVIGFDGLDETQYSLPALTTVDPGREEIADTAVGVLAERIERGGASGNGVPGPRMTWRK